VTTRADPIPLPTVPLGDANDPRVQRYYAIRRLWQARYDLECALGYLQNSDGGSKVIVDTHKAIVDVELLQNTLEWRQRREETP
jgi:hypothetical protein